MWKLSLTFLAAFLLAGALSLPTEEACTTALTNLGEVGLASVLVPCASEASETCCTNLSNTFAAGAASGAGECMCVVNVLNGLKTEITNNSAAQALNVNGDTFVARMVACGTPHAGNGC